MQLLQDLFHVLLEVLSWDGVFNDPVDLALDLFFDGAVNPQGFNECVAEEDIH